MEIVTRAGFDEFSGYLAERVKTTLAAADCMLEIVSERVKSWDNQIMLQPTREHARLEYVMCVPIRNFYVLVDTNGSLLEAEMTSLLRESLKGEAILPASVVLNYRDVIEKPVLSQQVLNPHLPYSDPDRYKLPRHSFHQRCVDQEACALCKLKL